MRSDGPLKQVDSGLDFFAVANYNYNLNLNNGSDPTLFDYHSSNIYDNFDATFGSVEDAYCS